jgi:cytochrome P450
MLKNERDTTDILSVAIESGGFTDDDLVNQLMTFLIAGHETTASALSWAICMLCKHPKIQTRLRDEIRSAIPDPRSPQAIVSANDIDNLTYLNAVCNEVLRLYPGVPITLRVAATDTSLLGHFIPKGTSFYISPWATNANKELWGDDAAEFNPERWIGSGKANTGGAENNYSFLTFLQGPRSCIGQGFAKGEFACLLAAWAGVFETRFAKEDYEISVRSGITPRPKDLEVTLKVLEGW